jgi:hypothetical protein
MEIKHGGSQPSAKGPAEYFTGNVRVDPLFPATDPSRVSAGLVTFEPGARGLTCPSARPEIDRHCWLWLGPALGRSQT